MNKQELVAQILSIVEQEPGLMGREIAERLGIDKKQVNGLLYGPLRGKLHQDNQYRWYPSQQAPSQSTASSQYADTVLARLARYYLACMGQDERGVSTFSASKYGEPDYVELPLLPQQGDIFQQSCARSLLGRRRNDKGRMEVFFGYPTVLRPHQSAKGWRGFFIEPLFLFPVELEQGPAEHPSLQSGFPILNHKALQFLTRTQREALMEELVHLEEELGLSGQVDSPDLDELAMRLQTIRPEWPWVEEIDTEQLGAEPTLAQAQQGGLYNRAVLVMAERSPFTQGLESELKQLTQLSASQFSDTALGNWIQGTVDVIPGAEQRLLVEVLPLNTEQRQAIQQALSNKLTIVTGPPGTGKSQVVTDLLINAAWQGKRVLFASKNNKAVDVVETRINSLGPRPILLRVGSQQYQTRLAEYLLSMLSTTATAEDRHSYEESLTSHNRVVERLVALDQETEQLISLRNRVDALDQAAEKVRELLTAGQFAGVRELDLKPLLNVSRKLAQAIDAATRDKQPLFGRVLWTFKRKERLAQLNTVAEQLPEALQSQLALEPVPTALDELSLPEWGDYQQQLQSRLDLVEHAIDYFEALEALQNSKSLEQIGREQTAWIQALSDNAQALWKAWLVTQPSALSREDRQKLNRYHSLLKMVIDTGPDGSLSREVGRQYRAIFGEVSHLLPCWATTALSARGKIPFEAGFFDLVVFDEASQCDIASALPLLYRAKQAVVIGDPKQLSHISGLQRGQDQQLLEKHGLLNDFPHWAYSYNSLFDLAAGIADGESIVNLRDHHRCHSDIIEFSNQAFYEGRLRVATRHDRLVRPNSQEPGIRWVHVQGQAHRPASGGAENLQEAHQIRSELRQLILECGYQGSVGVVSPFRSQANLIRKVVHEDEALATALTRHEFLVDTVHRFQGDERDLMIFSPVVATGVSAGALGFMRNTPNLFNVAITRARGMLVVVGDAQACASCGIDYLEHFARYTQQLTHAAEQAKVQQVVDLGSEYPSVSNPEHVSDWERHFYKALYQAGIRALPQYRVEKYALDLAVFDGDRRLDIEVDGERYHRNWTGELCRRDQMRNQRLFELGWYVKRFWVYEIRDDLDGCIKQIKDWLEAGNEPI